MTLKLRLQFTLYGRKRWYVTLCTVDRRSIKHRLGGQFGSDLSLLYFWSFEMNVQVEVCIRIAPNDRSMDIDGGEKEIRQVEKERERERRRDKEIDNSILLSAYKYLFDFLRIKTFINIH